MDEDDRIDEERGLAERALPVVTVVLVGALLAWGLYALVTDDDDRGRKSAPPVVKLSTKKLET